MVVVPVALRKEMMASCHDTHIGIEGCIRRARESMFWPRMATDLKVYISKCDVCMVHRPTPQKETLQPHEFTPRPWSKVGADLCELHGRTLLVVCDYFSNYIEVENLQTTTTRAVCKAQGDGQWATVFVGRVCHIHKGLEFRALHIVTSLPTIEWKGRECGQDYEASFHKMPQIRAVRIPCTVGLEEHTH